MAFGWANRYWVPRRMESRSATRVCTLSTVWATLSSYSRGVSS